VLQCNGIFITSKQECLKFLPKTLSDESLDVAGGYSKQLHQNSWMVVFEAAEKDFYDIAINIVDFRVDFSWQDLAVCVP